YQEAMERFGYSGEANYSALPDEIGKSFGVTKCAYSETSYVVIRRINPFTGYEELYIYKGYLTIDSSAAIWAMTIRISNSPPYSTSFRRYPVR
ncbi:MAG: hypothetical protein ACPL1K_06325, partial [Candidatus Kryptoniota bacterium]